MAVAVSRLTLTAGPRVHSQLVHVKSVVNKLAMGQVSLRVLRLSFQYNSTNTQYSSSSSSYQK